MARRVRSTHLETKASRSKLEARNKPYWVPIGPGLHLGYRKGKLGGHWVRRIYLGDQRYDTETFAAADDRDDSDGATILTWWQAQEAARRLRDEFARPKTAALTIRAACAEYVDDLATRKSARAAKGAWGRLHKHLLPTLGDRLLAELTSAEFLRWRNGLVLKTGDDETIRKSRDSANRMAGIARAAFNHARAHHQQLTDDHAWRTVKNFAGAGESRKVVLNEDELQRLVDACGPGLRELVLAGAMTGCRLGELTNARARDFEADATLTVNGKTGRRTVHLAPDTVALMRRVASGKRADQYLFTTEAGGRWAESLHTRPFRAAVARAGLDPATTFYALRHTWISRALANGVPVKATADAAGTSIMMLQRFYAKFIPGDEKRYAVMAQPALRLEPVDRVVAIGSRARDAKRRA
jgi:integrase